MLAQIALLAIAMTMLAACGPKPASVEEEAAPEAPMAVAVLAPPPPPPFVDCTDEERSGVQSGISAWVGSTDTCVANRTAIRTTVSSCKHETATGYLHARGTANYEDTILENTYYSMEVMGQFGPTGAPVTGTVSANPNVAWQDACKFAGFLEGISKNNSSN